MKDRLIIWGIIWGVGMAIWFFFGDMMMRSSEDALAEVAVKSMGKDVSPEMQGLVRAEAKAMLRSEMSGNPGATDKTMFHSAQGQAAQAELIRTQMAAQSLKRDLDSVKPGKPMKFGEPDPSFGKPTMVVK